MDKDGHARLEELALKEFMVNYRKVDDLKQKYGVISLRSILPDNASAEDKEEMVRLEATISKLHAITALHKAGTYIGRIDDVTPNFPLSSAQIEAIQSKPAKERKTRGHELLGQKVTVWTSSNGEYVGILEEESGSPWRGNVRITGILAPASRMDGVPRKGLRTGDIIEAGGVNIKKAPEGLEGGTYLQVLEGQLRHAKEAESRPNQDPKYSWVYPRQVKALTDQIADEKERLAKQGMSTLPYPGQRSKQRSSRGKGWKSKRMH